MDSIPIAVSGSILSSGKYLHNTLIGFRSRLYIMQIGPPIDMGYVGASSKSPIMTHPGKRRVKDPISTFPDTDQDTKRNCGNGQTLS